VGQSVSELAILLSSLIENMSSVGGSVRTTHSVCSYFTPRYNRWSSSRLLLCC